ncbi:MAG: hypothetical protein GEU80_05355 [Dehalococcoidia bacterium]|nr:hypothetical protein [Dehalococcoidia bacterium]
MSGWPALLVEEWVDTRDTLHIWTQIIGKIRLEVAPMINHWWQVPLYVSTRGLTTSPMPFGTRTFEMHFDFCDHQLHIDTSDPDRRSIPLEPKPVATFYEETMAALAQLGIHVDILARPVEVEPAIPFAEDYQHASYDPDAAHRFWRQLVQADRVMTDFRSRYIGKASPVHFFWGSFDLAVTRFSGRSAPRHPGGSPNVADWVMEQAYSHELSSAGFWPGGSAEGAFYAYAYPAPDGFAAQPVSPRDAHYDPDLREFLLPHESVRTAGDPDAALMAFLQSTYEAVAELGRWDRSGLET